LTLDEMDNLPPNTIVVHTPDIDDLIQNGFLNFSTLLQGLEDFIAWGRRCSASTFLSSRSHSSASCCRTPLTSSRGKSDQTMTPTTLGELLACLPTNLTSGSRQGVLDAANQIRDVLKQLHGVEVIGDGNRDGVVEDAMSNGLLVSGNDLLRLEPGETVQALPINGATITVNADGTFKAELSGFPFADRGIFVGEVVRYNNGAATGTVKRVAADHLVVQMDDPTKPPTDQKPVAGIQNDLVVDTHEIAGATFLLKFAPDIQSDPLTLPFDLGLPFLKIESPETNP
jgi:hypothetical protein